VQQRGGYICPETTLDGARLAEDPTPEWGKPHSGKISDELNKQLE